MKIYEKKEVVITEKTLKSITCDKCKKDITTADTNYYFEVTTSHNLWGNDSVDSFKYLDFCSFDCLLDNLNHYYSNSQDTYSYEIERVRKYRKKG